MHRVFLSHNHNDKPLVEPVALKLAEIFGQEQVFYDSWSISPGDSIIDKMSNGLEAPEFVFFFVSKNSLASAMVKLEWQNALYIATKGKTRIVPVRIDGSDMPAILKQTLFIDMYTIGLDAAIAQIVSVTQGNASFTPQHQGFSNLSYVQASSADGSIEITIKASHFMEPHPNFAFITENKETEITWKMHYNMFEAGFNKGGFSLNNGKILNLIVLRLIGKAFTPGHPVRASFRKKTTTDIGIIAVLHEKGENNWVPVPASI